VPRTARIAAPGDQVVAAGPRGKGAYVGSGPSCAAAYVAGAAALVRSYRPELTQSQVAERLLGTAYPAATPRLDPYGALTGQVAAGAKAAAPPAVAIPERGAGRGGLERALAAVGVAVTLSVGVGLAWAVRRR
jgi:subtilisin family serine protease